MRRGSVNDATGMGGATSLKRADSVSSPRTVEFLCRLSGVNLSWARHGPLLGPSWSYPGRAYGHVETPDMCSGNVWGSERSSARLSSTFLCPGAPFPSCLAIRHGEEIPIPSTQLDYVVLASRLLFSNASDRSPRTLGIT